MKKKISIVMIVFVVLFGLLNPTKTFASSDEDEEAVTQKLYQDITINKDGSITVKEVALLNGTYNGREREINFSDYYSYPFTGIYSNFAGGTDIYDGTAIKNIKIYDISQENFNSINDMNKIEKQYKEVESASSGKYGVYTVSKNSRYADFRIYCPSKKNKVFYMEYTITDVVVIHNDIAELYWNVLGDNYREEIVDYQVVVHLPGEDTDLRVWSHGPPTGVNSIIDRKTVSLKDTNVKPYNAETIRIMFNTNLVPEASKVSSVDGMENILKYEASQADPETAETARKNAELTNKASDRIANLEKYKDITFYNYALDTVNEMPDGDEKTQFLSTIENLKDVVNQDWKDSIDEDFNLLNYSTLTRYKIKQLQKDIDEGFDEQAKSQYNKKIEELTVLMEEKEANIRKNCTTIVEIIYAIILVVALYKLFKIQVEKNTYKGQYYRDFPSGDNPYVIEYLMKHKITNLSISATILNLIAKKVIEIEEKPDKKDTTLILKNFDYSGTESENIVLQMLFNVVGKDYKCTLDEFKNYGSTESKAKQLRKKVENFNKSAKKEAENKNYFKKIGINTFINIAIIVAYIICLFMAFGVFNHVGTFLNVTIYLGIITVFTIISCIIVSKDKSRTQIGKEEYSKWLAHKRFLNDFSKFDEKDLPEIILWDKYLVTATILGCADKVQKKMKFYINDYDTSNINYTNVILLSNLNTNFVNDINHTVSSSISKADSTYAASSYSGGSSGGFGGGSFSGGGGRWTAEAAEDVSKI